MHTTKLLTLGALALALTHARPAAAAPTPGAIEVVHHRPRIIEARCTGCGTCLARCPAPVLAIALVPATAPRAPAPAVSPAVAPAAVATTAPRSPR